MHALSTTQCVHVTPLNAFQSISTKERRIIKYAINNSGRLPVSNALL